MSAKGAARFAFPTAANDSSCCSTSSPRCEVVSVLKCSHFNMCVVYLIAALISHSLVIMLNIYLYAYLPSMHLLQYGPDLLSIFSFGLFVFLLLRWDFFFFWCILYTIEWFVYFGYQWISDMCFANILSQSAVCLFSSTAVFCSGEVFFPLIHHA